VGALQGDLNRALQEVSGPLDELSAALDREAVLNYSLIPLAPPPQVKDLEGQVGALQTDLNRAMQDAELSAALVREAALKCLLEGQTGTLRQLSACLIDLSDLASVSEACGAEVSRLSSQVSISSRWRNLAHQY
jgi:hypothetical protein